MGIEEERGRDEEGEIKISRSYTASAIVEVANFFFSISFFFIKVLVLTTLVLTIFAFPYFPLTSSIVPTA